MADIADNAGDHIEKTEITAIESIRQAAANIQKGYAGECGYCGEESQRLVGGACAPCRDRYNLT